MVLDSSLIDINGVPRNDPHPLGLESAVTPLRPSNVDQATSIMLATNAAQHDARLRAYLKSIERDCIASQGPVAETAVCAELVRIGMERMDGYGSVLVGDTYFDCAAPEAIAWLNRDPHTLSKPAHQHLEEKRRQCQVMTMLRSRQAQTTLGLGDHHPQCYVEATRSAQTNYLIDDDMATCLRHAARWAVATRMAELCLDPRFGGALQAGAGGKILPVGISCPLPLAPLPRLPRECAYSEIVNGRPWVAMPRQTAHCGCVDRYNCQPEALLDAQAPSAP
jgi:hypothetical protein